MPLLETKRLFVAIQLPDEIKKSLCAHRKELEKSGADAKWVQTENIHLTIKFLGSVAADKVKEITATLDKVFAAQHAFETALTSLGCFPSLARPRVIWAGLEDEKKNLESIAQRTENALSRIGFEKETRGYSAHATLGRIRSPRNQIALIEKINQANLGFKKEVFRINNLTLFESHLSPHGSTYSIVHQINFK